MKDVAQRAAVSITTVSHVINKTRYVKSETTNAVLRAIQELNYHTKKNAKSNGEKYIEVGVIVGDLREDYFPGVIKAIETIANDLDVSIIICDSETDPEKEKRNIQMLLNRDIRGLILAPTNAQVIPKELRDSSVPVVLIDRQYENHNYFFVGINNFQSSYQGTSHIFSKGSRKIGFIGYEGPVSTMRQRILGFKAFMSETLPSEIPEVLLIHYNTENSFPLIKDFIEKGRLDGLFCANSSICNEAIGVLPSLKDSIRQKLQIICYDDNRWFDYLKYPISIICQPVAEIGNAALEHLFRLIEQPNNDRFMKRELLFDVTITDRP
jgi:LacI family transcriptional regulator